MMPDISEFMAPKSDQLGGDDFVTGPVTVKIVGAQVDVSERRVKVFIEGHDRFWLPCKTTLRIMAAGWQTARTEDWVGRYVTLFRDPAVVYGGAAVGGIRVSAMSHIDRDFSTPVAISKAVRKVWKVKALEIPVEHVEPAKPAAPGISAADLKAARDAAGRGTQAFRDWCKANPIWKEIPAAKMDELHAVRKAADVADDPFGLPPTPDPTAHLTPEQIEATLARVADEIGSADE